jgi:adenosylhomocysteine nucleosidase
MTSGNGFVLDQADAMCSAKPVGVLSAIPEEMAAFGAHFRESGRVTVGGLSVLLGALDGRPVALAESGIGKVNGALAATVLLDRFDCRGLIFSGVAGGVDPALSVGDLVVATRVIQHDYGALSKGLVETYRAGVMPFPEYRGEAAFAADACLIARAQTALDKGVRFGTVLTGDAYLACVETRERLFASFGGMAVDMESGAVAQVAEAFGRPWLIIRALSDLAGEDSQIDFLAFVHEAARNAAATVLKILPLFDLEGNAPAIERPISRI